MAPAGLSIDWLFATLMVSLRITPAFVLAPPFSLVAAPPLFRVLFGLGVAACLVSAHPAAAHLGDVGLGHLVVVSVRELALGAMFALTLQLMFAGLYLAGRTLDIQAGFGLAVLIDPTTRAQTPLIGSLFAYAAGMAFFAMDGHAELLRILGATLEAIPLGGWRMPVSLGPLSAFISTIFLVSFGVAGGAILVLFLADMAIAALARTAPQMNVLILGLQVKVLLLLVTLPVVFGVAGALLARLARITLESLPRLVAA